MLVSSVGGHLAELLTVCGALDHQLVWVLNDESPVLPASEEAWVIAHAERDWRLLWNLVELTAILSRERPDVVVSMGAAPAVPAALLCRAFGIPVIYAEPSSAVRRLTLTGRLMKHLASRYFVQWESLLDEAPWAEFGGSVV